MNIDFQKTLKDEFEKFVRLQENRFPCEETLKADLHCHDFNSDVPDELTGRILNVPETWLPSETLIEKLGKNACNVFTVTNHNNARSCYALQDKGLDMLVGAEFSIRSYIDKGNRDGKKNVDISAFLDGLSFPFFGASLILAAHFISAKVMFNNRPLLNDFSRRIGRFEHPERILWLTDTWEGDSEAAVFLREIHAEIKWSGLPVDIVTCSSSIQSDEHLTVLPPVREFPLHFGKDYVLNIPDFIALHNLFLSGGYSGIICSTEGVMGIAGLYLKHAYSVEASFCMHTDRLKFAREVMNMEGHNLNRFRRILRFFYQSFDGVVAIKSDTNNAKIVKEIIRKGKDGFLVRDRQEMYDWMIEFLNIFLNSL
jgi:hypothetical protein